MSEEQTAKLSSLLNASGFVFQMALEHYLCGSAHEHKWDVVASEHPWLNTNTGKSGYIDLILNKGAFRLVVECKRSRDGDWVFLLPKGHSLDSNHLRCQWAQLTRDGSRRAGCFSFHFPPSSAESAFCVVRGQGEGDPSLLERMAGALLNSVDCLTAEELDLAAGRRSEELFLYLPAIVTTARLFVCRFDPHAVPLQSGVLPDGEFTPVNCVRFTKSLTPHLSPEASPMRLDQANLDKIRTVLVISAGGVSEVLKPLEIARRHHGDMFPWDERR